MKSPAIPGMLAALLLLPLPAPADPDPPPAVTGRLEGGGSVHAGGRSAEARAPGFTFRLEGVPPAALFDLEIRPFAIHAMGPEQPPFPVLRDLAMPLSGDLDLGTLSTRTHRLAVLLRDPAGAPLPGADVALHFPQPPPPWRPGADPVEAPRRPTATATADAAGRAVLERVPGGFWTLHAAAPGRAAALRGVHLAADREETVVLPPAHALRGTLRDAAGRPVPGARILAATPFPPFPSTTPAAVTDARGRFLLEGLAEGFHDLAVLPSPDRCAAGGAWLVPEAGSADLVLEGGAALRGVVREAGGGGPVPGAAVHVLVTGSGGDSRTSAVVLADPGGRFEVEDLPPGRVASLRAEKPGWAGAAEAPPADPVASLLSKGRTLSRDLLLRRAASRIRGRVLGPEGRPVAGASVSASSEGSSSWQGPGAVVRTGADGAYLLRGLPAGWARVRAAAEGLFQPGAEPPRDVPLVDREQAVPRDRVEVPADGEAVLDIALARMGVLSGVVVDPAGNPLPGVSLGSLATDAGGRFRMTDARPRWPHRLVVRDPAWWGEAGPFLVEPGEERSDLRVPVVPAGSVSGVVRGPDGKPAAGVRVLLERGAPGDQPPGPERAAGARWGGWQAACTDGAGSFRIGGLDPASLDWRAGGLDREGREIRVPSLHLVLRAPGLPPRAVAVPEPGPGSREAVVEVDLPAGRTLTGLVKGPGGRPLAGVRVRVLPATRVRDRVLHGSAPWQAGVPVRAATGEDGRFEARTLPEGPWEVELSAPGFHPRVLAAEEGSVLEAALEPAVALRGKVTGGTAGGPVPGCLVTARVLGAAEAWQTVAAAVTGPDGSFEIPGLGPVTHEVRVEPPADSDWAPDRREHAPDGRTDLAIALRTGLTLAGVVVDGEDRPVPGARVRLHPEDPKRRRDLPGIVTSGADGAFRFRGLEEGTYRISIQEPGGGLRPWNGPDSEDPLSGHLLSDGLQGVPAGTEEAILRVRRALPVTGRLVGVDGKRPPLDGRLLLVGDAPAGGRPRKETLPIRDDGSFRTPPLDPALTWEIRASGYEGSAGGVVKEVRPGARDLVVPLEAGLPLAGRVLDQDGAPVPAGARVLARAAGYDEDYPSAAGTATVEEDGRFEFPRLLSIPYRVAVEAGRDIEPAPSQETWFPGGEPALLRATRFFAAAGKVVDDEGNPVPLTRALARAPGAPAYAAHGTGTTEGAFRIERIPFRRAEIAVVARGRTVILGTYGLPATDLVLPLSAEPAPDPPPEAKKEKEKPPEPRSRPAPAPVRQSRATEADPPGTRMIGREKVRPGPIEGRIVASTGGVPPGVEVTVHRLPDGQGAAAAEPSARVAADAAGAFRTPDLEAARYEVRVRAAGWKPESERSFSNRRDLLLTLEPGLSIAGVAVDAETGAPVPGIRVRMEPMPGKTGGYASGTTGPDGTFEIGFPPAGEYALVFGNARERQPWTENPGDFLALRMEGIVNGTAGIRAALTRGLALGGTLRDGEGGPLAARELEGMTVSFHAGEPGMESYPRMFAGWKKPGPNGEFRFGSLPPGRYTVSVAFRDPVDGGSVFFEPTTLDAGRTDLEIRVPLGEPISGRVVLPEETPRPREFQVEVRTICVHTPGDFSSHDPAVPSSRTVRVPVEADGTFRTGRLDGSKPHDLFVAVPGLRPGEARGLRAGASGVVLAPAPGAVLEGIVTDETGAPVPAGVPVTAAGVVAHPPDAIRATAGAATTEGGRFRIAGLDPGLDYRLLAGGQGTDWLPPAEPPVARAGADLVVLRLRRGVALSGTLLDTAGAPLPWTMVWAEPLDRGDLPSWYRWWARVDAKGEFRVVGLPAGKVRLLVDRPGKPAATFGPFDAPAEGVLLRLEE